MEFRRCVPIAVGCVLVLLAFAPVGAQAQAPTLPAPLDSVRKLLDKYNDPVVAVYDGFYSTVGCIEYPKGSSEGTMQYSPGGMGVHFLNLGNVSPTLDPAKPQVLIYEPVGDKLKLVAAEWFSPVDIVKGDPPSIFGKQLQGPMEGHQPLMPAGFHHYDLHVWLWKDNPSGVFSPTNPAIKCPAGAYSFAETAPKMVHAHH